jgi:hypothetical protein
MDQKRDSIDRIFAFPEWQVIPKLGLKSGLGRVSRTGVVDFEGTRMLCFSL